MQFLRGMPVLCLLALVGCGPSGPAFVPVSGVVTLDGVPVAGANVAFFSKVGSRTADGQTDAQGKFTLTTQDSDPKPGAIEGEHTVTVNGMRIVGAIANPDGTSASATPPRIEWFLPERYARPETSGLSQTVTKGMSPVELKLTAK